MFRELRESLTVVLPAILLQLLPIKKCRIYRADPVCSLNIVFFEDFKYIPDSGLSVSPWCQCVYTMAGQTPALQQNWQSSENHNILRKNTMFNEHPIF